MSETGLLGIAVVTGAWGLATSLVPGLTRWLPPNENWTEVPFLGLVGTYIFVVFGFLFVTVSSRITGEIGSSSNPISGMTVATLLLTCLIFWWHGWTAPADSLTALSVAAVVCIAASNGGTTSQDLKTGYLVGATPKWQQVAILVGALTSALVIGWVLVLLNNAYTIYTRQELPKLAEPVLFKTRPAYRFSQPLPKAPATVSGPMVWA